MTSAASPGRRVAGLADRASDFVARLDRPTATYYLLLTVTSLLVVFGLVMVLSASSIDSIKQSKTGSAYTIFLSQLLFASLGAVALWVASRLSVRQWKALALVVLGAGLVLQLLVLFIGVDVYGNKNWLRIGPVTVQPSEALKIGLALSGGLLLAPRRARLAELRHVVVPYLVPIVALALGLVLAGNDLGTGLVLGAIVAGVLFTAGVPARWFAAAGTAFVGLAVFLVFAFPHRLQRFDVWLGRDTNIYGNARQPTFGKLALADGGWFGVGLGSSREKWLYLSEPHNDFIFAIIGEELGLPGTLSVLALLVALVYACYRIVARSSDAFVRITTAGVAVWIAVQAMINIGAVTGLLPVIGLPLPLVSSGGSSLITTMFALGILLSFARSEPGCADALTARPPLLSRFRRRTPTEGT